MNPESTSSTRGLFCADRTHGSRIATPLLAGVLALANSPAPAEKSLVPTPTGTTWISSSTIGFGTPRAFAMKANHYQPRTKLGQRLLALRQAAIAKGMRLLSEDEIVAEVEASRG